MEYGRSALTAQSGSRGQERWPANIFLGMLSEPVREELLQLGIPCRYRPKETLIIEGAEDSRDVVFLLSGLVKVTKRLENGYEGLLAIRADGDVVGEMAGMDDAPRSATVTACSEIDARIVRRADLNSFLEACPEAFRAIARIIAQRLRKANTCRIEFGGYPIKVRVARVLAEMTYSHGRQCGWRGLVIGVNLTQSELAALAGSTKETVHKALKGLRNDGLITTGSPRTVVLDIVRLRQVARLDATGT
ncbi:putative transcriptional regulator, Crp/Fnr family [Actinobacteria bacterium OK074]|nr:putative transcriptional regulator, Crp/Fnr family [Actinobacteria bacterium OK074]